MDNISAQERIEDCVRELDKIEHMIEGMGKMSNPVPFLTKYAIIKTCGTIEFCFKTIIADFHDNQTLQVKNYINSTFRTSSINPSKSNICKSLNSFDSSWNENFKKGLESLVNKVKVEQSLESLNNARNTFAHGGHPSASFDNVKEYFFDAIKMIEILDKVVTT